MLFFKKIIYALKEYLFADKIIKNILVLSGGTALAQLINILAQPLITRIYTPDQYGLLSVFTSVLLVFRIATLRYEVAIPIPEENEDAIYLVIISFFALSLSGLVITVLLLINRHGILDLLNAEEMFNYWVFVPLGIFLQGIFLVLQGWMLRKREFKLIRQRLIIESISGNFLKILFGFLNFGSLGLIIAKIASIAIAAVTLCINFLKSNKNSLFSISLAKLKKNLKKYKDFPLFQTPSSLSLHLRNQLPILFIAPLYGPQVAGYFGLANQIIKIPMNIVGNSVMNVFFAEVASIGKDNPKKIKKLSDDLFKKLLLIGFFPMIIIVLFGPFLFGFVFGKEWIQAGNFARILSLYVFANFIFSPINRIYEVFGKQKEKFIIDAVSLIILVLLFGIAWYSKLGVENLLYSYTIIMFLVYFITYLLSNKILNKEIKKCFETQLK